MYVSVFDVRERKNIEKKRVAISMKWNVVDCAQIKSHHFRKVKEISTKI